MESLGVTQLACTLSPPTCPVLEGFYRLVQFDDAALRNPASQKLARRAPGHFSEVPIEVRLVVVAGATGQLGPVHLLPAVERNNNPNLAKS